ncbi:hypothetical protein MGN70_004316 [Eutypa lata]|nr:hypothetical protein MGN70_004316 [Eutypa lata]
MPPRPATKSTRTGCTGSAEELLHRSAPTNVPALTSIDPSETTLSYARRHALYVVPLVEE